MRPFLLAALACGATCGVGAGGAQAGTVTTVFAIPGHNDGSHPISGLIELAGKYYGATEYGGPNNGIPASGTSYTGTGTIYRIDLKTGADTIIYAFTGGADGGNPTAGLTALNGKLYGSTYNGGANSAGVVFSFDPATATQTPIYSFPAGNHATGQLTLFGGLFYITETCPASAGCIVSVDPTSGATQTAYTFPSSGKFGTSFGDLTAHGAYLYGVGFLGGSAHVGTLFRFNPAAGTAQLEYAFTGGTDGAYPNDGLTLLNDVFYGTTETGGTASSGTVYAFDPATHQETVLHSFAGPDGARPTNAPVALNGVLYGSAEYGGQAGDSGLTGNGDIFACNPATMAVSVVHAYTPAQGVSGSNPLAAIGGLLYGAQYYGGPTMAGLVFSVDPASGDFDALHDFAGTQMTGASGLIRLGGILYGTAMGGGANGLGSIYKLAPGTSAGATLLSFAGPNGAYPKAPLLDQNGTLYGTTNTGGLNNYGTLFSFTPAGKMFSTLATFADGKGGIYPVGPLAALNNDVFGTTTYGGAGGHGTIFQFNTATGQQTALAAFSATTGYNATGLIAANGLLYGTATNGGANKFGTIFQADPATGTITPLYAFQDHTDGAYPYGPLFYNNGLLYGTTTYSRHAQATVFAFDPATNTKTTLHIVKNYTELPAQLTEKGGKLYGTFPYNSLPTSPYGGIFRTNPVSGATTIIPFAGGASTNPASPLLPSNNALFGTTPTNTSANAGSVFKYVP